MAAVNKRSIGSIGEQIAVEFLEKNEYLIIKQNFRYGRIGEIDIISRDKEYLCFVEVKTRSSNAFGIPAEAVNSKKQKSMTLLAEIYLKQNNLKDINIRFDIVEIMVERKGNNLNVTSIDLIKNAF